MADKDKKLRVILKLPSKSSNSSKGGVSGPVVSSPLTFQSVQTRPVSGIDSSQKATAQILSSNTTDRVATPPKKRKFKTLVEGDARDDHGGVYGSSYGTVAAAVNTPSVFKAPLPPLAKKPSHKKKEKPVNGDMGASLPGAGQGQGSTGSPAKKVLEGVLDKLKKKDTYGVFSEPVDSRLVPDYYDVIKDPMDFGTMYKKISKGVYHTLSLFEKDIMLICSNAMRYNGPDTIYYKQARSIQDAARKALDVVAAQAGVPEIPKSVSHKKQPYSAKKGWKNTAAVKSLLEPSSSDFASGATLAAEGDDVGQSNKSDIGYSKKGAPSDRSGSVAGEEAGYGVQSIGSTGLEPDPDLQDEQGATLKPATLKDGRRPLSTEEYHRSSYKPRNLPAHGRGPPLAGVGGELHHLVPTGYQSDMAYARSLSQFASKLGPEGWKYASQKMQRVLAPYVPFGQGWIGEHEAPPGTIFKKPPADTKVLNSSVNNQKSNPLTSATVHTPAQAPFSKVPRVPMISPVAQTSKDALLTTVTSAMLASGASSQVLLPGKSPMDLKSDKAPQSMYQLEQNRSSSDALSASTGRPVWISQAPSSQSVMSTMTLQSSSEPENGVSSRWTASASQAGPTFVYSTAVRTVPTLASNGQDEASKAQAHSLGLLQADANARAKMQASVHLSQAPRPMQYMQPQLYNAPSYSLQPGSLVRAPYGSNQLPPSSQPLQASKHEVGTLKPAISQPLQLQYVPNQFHPSSQPPQTSKHEVGTLKSSTSQPLQLQYGSNQLHPSSQLPQTSKHEVGTLKPPATAQPLQLQYGSNQLHQSSQLPQTSKNEVGNLKPPATAQPLQLQYGSNQLHPSSQPPQISKHELGILKPATAQHFQLQYGSNQLHSSSQAPLTSKHELGTLKPPATAQPLQLQYGSNQLQPSSQLPQTSKHEMGTVKSATSQPLQLQMGSLSNYGLSQNRLGPNPSALQQTHTSKPPPDLNLQPLDSPSTPQTSGQLNALGSSQPSLSLQL